MSDSRKQMLIDILEARLYVQELLGEVNDAGQTSNDRGYLGNHSEEIRGDGGTTEGVEPWRFHTVAGSGN